MLNYLLVTLALASDWFNVNLLSLNNSKTQKLTCSLSNDLVKTSSVKLLGFTIDSLLKWDDHIDSLCTKLSRVIYLLRKLKSELPGQYLRAAYFAFFHSHLTYGTKLWGHASSVSKVLVIQKRAVRILANAGPLQHCKPLFVELGIMTVVNMYIFQIIIGVKLNINDYVFVNQVHGHNTRRCRDVNRPRCRLEKTVKTFLVAGIKCFNRLPVAFRDFPNSKFIKRTERWLLDHPFYKLSEFYEADLSCI